jgi:rRNA maturation RNase YbeY
VKKNIDRSPLHFLGDVVISVPTARRQARERRHGLRREMAWLMIHGILHLLGYDHEKANDARRMRRKERALLRQFV